MKIINTYIIINITNIHKLKQIKHFEMNLGYALTDQQNRFNPGDINIAKHYTLHKKIISLLGYIGTLPIYTDRQLPINTIEICNEDIKIPFELKSDLSMYDNINEALKQFFEQTNLTVNVNTEKEEKQEVKVEINKPLKEMTMEERIAFVRSRS